MATPEERNEPRRHPDLPRPWNTSGVGPVFPGGPVQLLPVRFLDSPAQPVPVETTPPRIP